MKVSIITICFNSEKTLKDTIESVVNQDYNNIEYIIVDGQSTDHTLSIIKDYASKYPFIRYISERDKGIYDGMNKGIKMATGDLLAIINSDDFYKSSDVISTYVVEFKKNKYDLAYSNIVIVDRERVDVVRRFWKSGYGKVKNGWLPPHPSVFVRKEIYERFGLFDLNVKSVADTELLIRILKSNEIVVKYIDIISVVMRDGGESNQGLKSRKKHLVNDAYCYHKNGYKLAYFIALKKQLRKIPQLIFKK